MRGPLAAVATAIGAAALLGAALLLARGEAGGAFVARPAVVLPLLVGSLACAAATVRARRSRGAFALLGMALGMCLMCTGLAVTTASGIALAVASAMRPMALGAMALIGTDLVLARGQRTVRRIVAAATGAAAVLILLFQPMDTSFGSWPAVIPLPPAVFGVLAPVAMVLVQAVLCAPVAVAVVGWVRVLRGAVVLADAWVATLPVAIGGLSLLLSAWSAGNHGDSMAPATLAWAAVGAAAAALVIATLLTRGSRVVTLVGAMSAAGLLMSGSTAAAIQGGGDPGTGAVASGVTLAAVVLAAAVAAVRLGRGTPAPNVAPAALGSGQAEAPVRDASALHTSTLVRDVQSDPRLAALTRREREMLDLLATGLTSREIAERTYLSPRTVDAHLRSVYRKLDVTGEGSPRMRAAAIWRGDE